MDYLYSEALKYGYDVYKQEFTSVYTSTTSVVGHLDGVELALGSFRGSPSTDGSLTASLVAVNAPGCATVNSLLSSLVFPVGSDIMPDRLQRLLS